METGLLLRRRVEQFLIGFLLPKDVAEPGLVRVIP